MAATVPFAPFPDNRRGTSDGAGFARLLAEYRDRCRGQRRSYLSQSELAERAGFDHSYVSLLECGSRLPTRAAVMKLAEAMSLTEGERDALLAAAGFLPGDINNLYASEPVIVELAALLMDHSIDASARDHVRYVTGLLIEQAQRTRRHLTIAAD